MGKYFEIGNVSLNISTISEILENRISLKLSSDAKKKMRSSRKYLNQKIKLNKNAIYGVNTGFGSLCNHKILDEELKDLQSNLILSHACGTGDKIPDVIAEISKGAYQDVLVVDKEINFIATVSNILRKLQ